jgi:hypothetical protein
VRLGTPLKNQGVRRRFLLPKSGCFGRRKGFGKEE